MIIIALIVCFVLFVAAGVYFMSKGFKTADAGTEVGFSSMGRAKAAYRRSAKMREERCVIYISVGVDNCRHLYSAAHVNRVLEDIKTSLLTAISDGEEDTVIAACGATDVAVISRWSPEYTRERVEACQNEIGKCLLEHNVLNVVDVRFGACAVLGTQVLFDAAVKRAKQACMLAKQEKLGYVEWNATDGKALTKRVELENRIESEIDNNRFFLEYQPVLDAHTKKIVGVEVLARLNSEQEGILTPGRFLSAVNSVGLSEKFDYYIFEKNCKWISNDRGMRERYRYTINFSRSTLSEPDFASRIMDIVERYDLRASCLAVEILEDKDVTGQARERMVENLAQLKEHGFSILLDDFGSGYTAFSDLQNLDVSIVKIDKSITQNATTETGFLILQNMIKTAKDLGFKTLCEGVETEEQERKAIEAGCDLLQGFYYYRPMPVAQLEKLFGGSLNA